MSEVDLLLEPIDNEGNTLPIVRVNDQVFLYDRTGLHTIPAPMFQHRESWMKLGKSSVITGSKVAVKAYDIFSSRFRTFDAVRANPVRFVRELLRLFTDLRELSNIEWSEMEEQDWTNILYDSKQFLRSSGQSFPTSGAGSFNRTSFRSN